ncbi:MAG TPA: enoyl-CoA hydratase-related protein [Myxococcota bacterium]|nr:enoyl-CoA hydratase-related protein [Myxococcota bacterium]
MPLVELSKPSAHVRLVTLNRPERMNALSFDTVLPLREALSEVAADHDARVAIVTGAGRGFCSGLDLEDAGVPPGIAGLPLSRIATRAMEIFADLVPAMREMNPVVIAAVNGPAYGGGLCLAAGADLRLAGESARFCGAGIRNGLTGTELGVSWILPRLVGAAHAFDLLLTGRELDARDAERIGLVSRVVPDGELLDTALAVAEQICGFSAHGVAMTKRVLWSNLEVGSLRAAMDLESRNQLLVRLTTQNLDEAIRARKEGRKPRYVD